MEAIETGIEHFPRLNMEISVNFRTMEDGILGEYDHVIRGISLNAEYLSANPGMIREAFYIQLSRLIVKQVGTGPEKEQEEFEWIFEAFMTRKRLDALDSC